MPRVFVVFFAALLCACTADSTNRLDALYAALDADKVPGDASDVEGGTGDTGGTPGDVTDGPEDVDTGDTADGEEEEPLRGFLEACANDNQCESDNCILFGGSLVCTMRCEDSACPDDFVCRQEQGGEGRSFCEPPCASQCSTCNSDADCGGSGSRCVLSGDVGYCSCACSVELADCGDGFQCGEATSVDGQEATLCLPQGAVCSCPADMVGQERACIRKNEFGTCTGTETCRSTTGWTTCTALTPEEEVCDGIDNNCDGRIDERLEARTCQVANRHGTCNGEETCVDGEWVCDADTPEQEVCDGQDNNCNGQVDEGLCTEAGPCQAGRCDATTGSCAYDPIEGSCDNGDACTFNDVCSNGICVAGSDYCSGRECTNCTTHKLWSPSNGTCQPGLTGSPQCICRTC